MEGCRISRRKLARENRVKKKRTVGRDVKFAFFSYFFFVGRRKTDPEYEIYEAEGGGEEKNKIHFTIYLKIQKEKEKIKEKRKKNYIFIRHFLLFFLTFHRMKRRENGCKTCHVRFI